VGVKVWNSLVLDLKQLSFAKLKKQYKNKLKFILFCYYQFLLFLFIFNISPSIDEYNWQKTLSPCESLIWLIGGMFDSKTLGHFTASWMPDY